MIYAYGQGGGQYPVMSAASFGYGQGGGLGRGYAAHQAGPMYGAPDGGDPPAGYPSLAPGIGQDFPPPQGPDGGAAEADGEAAESGSAEDVMAALAEAHGQQQGYAPSTLIPPGGQIE